MGVVIMIVDKPRPARRELPPKHRPWEPAPTPADATEAARPRDATWLWMFGPLSGFG
jgi:hypothetical protein